MTPDDPISADPVEGLTVSIDRETLERARIRASE
jgi:hypothetical protein